MILGVVEGLTEFLPVSSTGHLIVAGRALGLPKSDAVDAFEIVIQGGAILAVAVHYRSLLLRHAKGLARKTEDSVRLFLSLLVGFLPIAILGKLFGHAIKERLFAAVPVSIALVSGGVLMLVIERRRKARGLQGEDGLEHVTPTRALAIGLGQCFALVPGTSRSMATIIAGQLTGLSTRTAAEFSFLLGLPTLGVATLYEGYKSRGVLAHEVGTASLAVGLCVSFLVAWAVIASFLRYLQKRGLEPFAFYRILFGGVVLWMALR